jgi:hypothetical protein
MIRCPLCTGQVGALVASGLCLVCDASTRLRAAWMEHLTPEPDSPPSTEQEPA